MRWSSLKSRNIPRCGNWWTPTATELWVFVSGSTEFCLLWVNFDLSTNIRFLWLIWYHPSWRFISIVPQFTNSSRPSFTFPGSVDASGPVSFRRPGDQRERHANVARDGGGRHHRSVPAADRWQQQPLPLMQESTWNWAEQKKDWWVFVRGLGLI